MNDPEPTPDPRLGIPATDLCPECEGTGWICEHSMLSDGSGPIPTGEPYPCPTCTPNVIGEAMLRLVNSGLRAEMASRYVTELECGYVVIVVGGGPLLHGSFSPKTLLRTAVNLLGL